MNKTIINKLENTTYWTICALYYKTNFNFDLINHPLKNIFINTIHLYSENALSNTPSNNTYNTALYATLLAENAAYPDISSFSESIEMMEALDNIRLAALVASPQCIANYVAQAAYSVTIMTKKIATSYIKYGIYAKMLQDAADNCSVAAKETYETTDDYIIKAIISLLHILECSRCIEINNDNSKYYELEYIAFDAISYFVKHYIHIDQITDPLKLEFIKRVMHLNINHTINNDLLLKQHADTEGATSDVLHHVATTHPDVVLNDQICRDKSKNISTELIESIHNYLLFAVVSDSLEEITTFISAAADMTANIAKEVALSCGENKKYIDTLNKVADNCSSTVKEVNETKDDYIINAILVLLHLLNCIRCITLNK